MRHKSVTKRYVSEPSKDLRPSFVDDNTRERSAKYRLVVYWNERGEGVCRS